MGDGGLHIVSGKYKLMRHVTFNPLLFWIAPGLISCIFIWNTIIHFFHSLWYTFSRHLSLYKCFIFLSIINSGWWIVKLSGSSLKRHQHCVCSTLKSANVIILSLVRLFQLWVPKSQNGECWLTGLKSHALPLMSYINWQHSAAWSRTHLIQYSLIQPVTFLN